MIVCGPELSHFVFRHTTIDGVVVIVLIIVIGVGIIIVVIMIRMLK